MATYEMVIGLEVHVELATRTKIFCGCTTKFGGAPNTHTCPVCTGMPGTLPVANKKVVEFAVAAGLATNCEITRYNKFDRKNYFYPDLPKAYQISQLYLPICRNGHVDIVTAAGAKSIGIHEIHMEEDAGKLVHQGATITTSNSSLADYNRAGVPLIEIVSEPDMRSAADARAYLEELRAIIVYTGVSDAKMEEGSLRCDVNISLRPVGEEKFGTRAEIKNLNSFRAVERAIEYEIERQTELLEDGEKVRLETRTWDDAQGMTFSLRSKEEADEYRYFPEPDLPPIVLTEEWIQGMKESLPELPRARRARLAADGIGPKEAAIITQDIALADFYDAAKALLDEPQMITNWLVGDIQAKLNASGKTLAESGFTPERLVQLLTRIKSGDISGKIAKDVFMKAFDENRDPAAIIEEEGLQQISDTDSLAPMIQEIIDSNPKSVADYKAGKKKALGFFVGQVMKATKGQANPGVVNEMIVELLEKM